MPDERVDLLGERQDRSVNLIKGSGWGYLYQMYASTITIDVNFRVIVIYKLINFNGCNNSTGPAWSTLQLASTAENSQKFGLQ
jgi:hypothetical protein